MEYIIEFAKWIIFAVLGLAVYYFKRDSEQIRENSKRIDQEVKSVEVKFADKVQGVRNEMYDYKLEAQREFLSKDEFVRTISNQDKKLDRIFEEVINIKNKQEAS